MYFFVLSCCIPLRLAPAHPRLDEHGQVLRTCVASSPQTRRSELSWVSLGAADFPFGPDELLVLCSGNGSKDHATFKPRPQTLAKISVTNLSQELCVLGLPCSPPVPHAVVCFLGQSHGVQPEDCLPLPVASSGLPVLIAAPE